MGEEGNEGFLVLNSVIMVGVILYFYWLLILSLLIVIRYSNFPPVCLYE